jgi:hypothetical protein
MRVLTKSVVEVTSSERGVGILGVAGLMPMSAKNCALNGQWELRMMVTFKGVPTSSIPKVGD